MALERTPGGYAVPRDSTRGWFELHPKRGLAGYGLSRALRILLDVLAGLTALEDTRTLAGQPFVHGELVPAMVRIDPSGTARLIPLAPWHWSALGTVPAPDRCGHLAPERLLGDAIDARADVFSAGVFLWEALAGRRLFEGDSVDSIVTRLMGGKVTLPQLPPELSWAVPLKAVAMCALSVDPEQRFANAAELADAIEAVAGVQVALHSEVGRHFAAPEPAPQPSVIVRAPGFPAHHSSLSALVAPAQALTPAEASRGAPADPQSSLPEGRTRRALWAIAAISCALSAFGVSTFARYRAAPSDVHGAARAAPVPGDRMPMPPALVPVPPAAIASAPSAVASSERAEPVEPVPNASPDLASEHDKSTKSTRSSNASKALVPKVRLPAKPARPPDKTAAKYGI